MRGAPFSESNFSRGLNVLDSPYSLQAGETRDCLNVVSTPRGAIKKRTGSTLFASGGVGNFGDPAVTDNFNRANEDPLTDAGKWTALPESLSYLGAGKVTTNRYEATASLGKYGARWNVAEQKDPAVDIEILVPETFLLVTKYEVWACLDAAGTSGYCAQWNFSYESGGDSYYELKLIKRVAGVDTTLKTSTGLRLKSGTKIGISVRGGKVVGWRNLPAPEAGWSLMAEVADATYTKGYSGFGTVTDEKGFNIMWPGVLDNFATGEMSAPVTSGTPYSLAAVVTSSSLTPYLILQVGKKLASIDKEGKVTQIKELTSEARACIIQSAVGKTKVQGPVFIVNGVDKPQYWKGDLPSDEAKPWEVNTAELLGVKYFSEEVTGTKGPPNGKYMVVAGNRIFMAGMANDASAVRFSGFVAATGGGSQPDPTLWPEENVVRFERSDATPITGLGVWGPYVLVFKGHKTYVVYNLDEGENRRISDSVGCVAFRSIVETPQGTLFLTPDQGVYSTNGASVHEVSRNVRPILQGIDPNTTRAAKINELVNAAGGFANGHYYLSYMAQDETMKTLDYDIVLGSWWLHDIAGNQWVLWEPSVGSASLYTIPNKAEAGVVKTFVDKLYKDSGQNYSGAKGLTSYWLSAWEPFFQYVMRHRINQPNQKKRVRQIFFDGSGSIIPLVFKNFNATFVEEPGTVGRQDSSAPRKPVNLTDETGWGESEGEWGGEGVWGGEVETGAARLYALGVARVWGVGFGNASDKPFEVDSYQYDVQFRKS